LPPGADPATATGEAPTELPPGAYARGKHVVEVAGQIAIAAVGTGGARGVKRIESLVEELGVKPPQVSTRAVCEAWLELRKEATELLELRKQLAKRQEELTGATAACVDAAAASPAAAAAARVFQEVGLPDTPRAKTHEVPLGPDGQPIGIRPAKREQKRKMPARFADDDAPPSPPRRSAEKRQKR
jgi:DNA methyltransferase 1-associated protein 1